MNKCVRCGKKEDDLRYLRHECLYDMSELRVPFKEEIFNGYMEERFNKYDAPEGKPIGISECLKRKFFTLKVCKECRGSWMETIETWFNKND